MAFDRATLGRTGIEVGRLGLSAGYGAPASAVEQAFDHGVNYFYWGSFRRNQFGDGLRRLAPRRDRFLLLLQSYSPVAALIGPSIERALRALRFDYTDILLLGLWNRPVPERVLDACRRLRERGLVRRLAVSTHNRPLIARLASDAEFDIFHVRYNAVHRGAERDVFPLLPAQNPPGMAAFTATSWRQLLGHRRNPRAGEDSHRRGLLPLRADAARRERLHDRAGGRRKFQHALEALGRGPMPEDELAWMRRVGDAIYNKPRAAK